MTIALVCLSPPRLMQCGGRTTHLQPHVLPHHHDGPHPRGLLRRCDGREADERGARGLPFMRGQPNPLRGGELLPQPLLRRGRGTPNDKHRPCPPLRDPLGLLLRGLRTTCEQRLLAHDPWHFPNIVPSCVQEAYWSCGFASIFAFFGQGKQCSNFEKKRKPRLRGPIYPPLLLSLLMVILTHIGWLPLFYQLSWTF